jgi:hypothetical protein
MIRKSVKRFSEEIMPQQGESRSRYFLRSASSSAWNARA